MNRLQTDIFAGKKNQISVVMREMLRGNGVLLTKIAVALAVLALGIALFFVCVYGILPALISQIDDQVQIGVADDFYEQTVEWAASPDGAAAVIKQPRPEAPAAKTVRPCFESVLEDNPEIVGRITIEGLGIRYLVTQTKDNTYYLTHGYDRGKSRSGAIFMDYRCDIANDDLKGHYVLYGHNMKNGAMFHKLKQYAEEKTFKDNRIIRFDTLYADHEWEVFSAYVTSTDFNYIQTSFADDAEWLKFLNDIQGKSMFQTDTKLSASDVILTLSTCSYEFDDARFVVHARLIR